MILSSSRRRLAVAGACALIAAVAPGAFAQQDFPSKGLRIIVPFTAGGSSDVQARMLAERLGRVYKQTVVVDNRPGAGGHIGGKAVVDAPGDGYTLMLGSIGLHATYGVYKKLSYNPSTDFKVLTVLAEMPHVVVANPALPAVEHQGADRAGTPSARRAELRFGGHRLIRAHDRRAFQSHG